MPFGRLERTRLPKPLSDINMTPLIDVMLVLLVIFMIAAPFMSSRLPLDLPQTDAAQAATAEASLTLSVTPQGQAFLNDQAVADDALAQRLREASQNNPDTELLLRADKSVPYGRIAHLLGLIQGAGLTRIGFEAEPLTPFAAPTSGPTP
jgi:biopolymer transport protein TolR